MTISVSKSNCRIKGETIQELALIQSFSELLWPRLTHAQPTPRLGLNGRTELMPAAM
jgi:hypothetical protein